MGPSMASHALVGRSGVILRALTYRWARAELQKSHGMRVSPVRKVCKMDSQ